jgi:FtsP/CotA-like multicopper oxidase with cupredoxin domain
MGLLAKLVNIVTTLSAALPQTRTSGNSTLGTLSAPTLPSFLPNNPLPGGYPLGSDSVTNTNPYKNSPNTGVTRYYTFNISRGTLSPDGYQKQMILVNGAYPGPTITANWGDTIQVTVENNIKSPAEGTSIHWHGFLQHNTQWMDGVPGLSQCPIAPGKSFTYSFKAELYGTMWYHAHYSAQYSDGVAGPIVIYGPKSRDYDIDLGPVVLTDLYHVPYLTTVEYTDGPRPMMPPPNITSDNNLINGKMNFNCSTLAPGDTTPCVNNAGVSMFKFTTGKVRDESQASKITIHTKLS